MSQDKKYILSYGGGVNSSALFFYILEKNLPLDLVIFSDTGEERQENYITINNMMKECLKRNIAFQKVTSHLGNLYDYYYNKNKVMSIMKRDCTGKFKISPLRKHIRSRFGKKAKFVMYIGISWDEATRCKKSNVKYIENSYPFVDDKIDRKGNIEILNKYNFKASKSSCIGCMFNKKNEWETMIRHNPIEFKRHKDLEMRNTKYPNIPIKEWVKKYTIEKRVTLECGNTELKKVLTKSYVTLNNQYRLEDLEKSVLSQKTLGAFVDEEITCDSIIGGCFL